MRIVQRVIKFDPDTGGVKYADTDEYGKAVKQVLLFDQLARDNPILKFLNKYKFYIIVIIIFLIILYYSNKTSSYTKILTME